MTQMQEPVSHKNIIMVGGGGHARVVLELLELNGYTVLGFTDEDSKIEELDGVNRLGEDSILDRLDPLRVFLAMGIGSVGKPGPRKRLFESFCERGFVFPALVHPSAIISPSATFADGAQIMAGAVVQAHTRIGKNVIVNTRASIDHDCIVGDHSHIAPGVTLSGSVHVGRNVHVGTGANVIQGVHLEDHCLIAAGAMVIRNVSPGLRVQGVPAKPFNPHL